MRESKIQKEVCDYAESRGWRIERFINRGMPDRMLISQLGFILFIEFKAPGEKPEKHQQDTIDDLWIRGHYTAVIDDVEEGKRLIDTHATRDGQE